MTVSVLVSSPWSNPQPGTSATATSRPGLYNSCIPNKPSMTTFHFTIDLKDGNGGRPAKVEWQAGDLATAQAIVEEMYGDEFEVTYHYAS